MQYRISKIRNLLPIVLNLIKFGGVAHMTTNNTKYENMFYERKFPLGVDIVSNPECIIDIVEESRE